MRPYVQSSATHNSQDREMGWMSTDGQMDKKDVGCVYMYTWSTAAAAKSLQSCPTLCDPIDGSLSGSTVPGILQARTLEWVAISFSSASKWKVKVKSLSRVRTSATPWTAAFQAPPLVTTWVLKFSIPGSSVLSSLFF